MPLDPPVITANLRAASVFMAPPEVSGSIVRVPTSERAKRLRARTVLGQHAPTTSSPDGQQLKCVDQHVGQHVVGKVVPWRAHPVDGADLVLSKRLIESGASSTEDVREPSVAGLIDMR